MRCRSKNRANSTTKRNIVSGNSNLLRITVMADEARRLREVLGRAEQADLCEVVVRANSTAGDIFKVFQDPKYRNRIAVFHYGGHANGYQLLLESAAADAEGLAAFIAQQIGVELVFLNGRSTEQQTRGLLNANVSVVISTSRAIDELWCALAFNNVR